MIQKYVEDIVLVEEPEIVEAMRWIWERMKIVVEPSSAVPLAAVFKNEWKGKIGIVISGGNVDLGQLPF
jgi:threonine dehydratase